MSKKFDPVAEKSEATFRTRNWVLCAAAVLLIHTFLFPSINPYFQQIIIFSGINIILAVSLNLVIGFTGQFSMGHAGFMSIGAYCSASMTTFIQTQHPEWLTTPLLASLIFAVALFLGGLLASAVGWIVGLPSLRLKGDYLAIVTLGFGEIIRVILLNISAVGGARGLPNIPLLSSFAWVYLFALYSVFCLWRVVRARQGREFIAVREDEIAAEAVGVHTTRAKVQAFVLAAFFAGVAGGFFGHYLRYLSPAQFDFNRSFEIIIMVILGGMGSISGSVIAAILLTVLKEALRPLQQLTQIDFRMILYSLFLIILMLTRPAGLFGSREVGDVLRQKFKGFKRRPTAALEKTP